MSPYQKSVTASVLIGLAVFQLIAISISRGWIKGFSPKFRGRMTQWHQTEGYVGIVIILVIAYYCLRLAPDSVKTARVYVHLLLGITVIGLVFSKVAVMRLFPRQYARMPLLGLLLFTALFAIWISSAGWYFVTQTGSY